LGDNGNYITRNFSQHVKSLWSGSLFEDQSLHSSETQLYNENILKCHYLSSFNSLLSLKSPLLRSYGRNWQNLDISDNDTWSQLIIHTIHNTICMSLQTLNSNCRECTLCLQTVWNLTVHTYLSVCINKFCKPKIYHHHHAILGYHSKKLCQTLKCCI
jgi:hypothetical protein